MGDLVLLEEADAVGDVHQQPQLGGLAEEYFFAFGEVVQSESIYEVHHEAVFVREVVCLAIIVSVQVDAGLFLEEAQYFLLVSNFGGPKLLLLFGGDLHHQDLPLGLL